MNDITILDAVERYIRGEMRPDERLQFENLRKTNAEIDQLVVEHTLFLQQLNHFGERKELKSSLNEIHTHLTEQGKIESTRLKGKAKVVYLWKRYKRVTAIAASIAGITALAISALVWSVSPKSPSSGEFEKLNATIQATKNKTDKLEKDLNIVKTTKDQAPPIPFKPGGTGFIIDPKGYLVTNFHVVEKYRHIAVQNGKGEFNAEVIYTDKAKDIAILKIND